MVCGLKAKSLISIVVLLAGTIGVLRVASECEGGQIETTDRAQ